MKGMKRTTLIMVVLGLGIGGWVWWESRRGEEDDGKVRLSVEIFPFVGEEVTQVELVKAGATIAVAKMDGVWRMTSPRAWPAGDIAMMTMLRGVDPSEKAWPLPSGEKPPDAAVHGLDAPTLTVTLSASDGRKASIAFGKSLGAGDKTFARRAGQSEVLTVSSAMFAAFDRTPESLRDTGFCRFNSKELRSIAYSAAGKDVVVARQGRGWRLSKAVDDLADPAAVEEWVSRLATATSATMLPRPRPARSEYGLDPAFAEFEIELTGKKIRVSVGAPVAEGEKRRWADTSEYPDDIGTMDDQVLQLVTPLAGALRANRALPWPMNEVEVFSASGAADFEVRKDAGAWTVVKPAVIAYFDPARVDILLRQLGTSQVNARSPASAAPAGALHMVFRFGKGAEAVDQAADLWTDGTDTFFRTADPERVVRELGTSAWVHASAGAFFFRDPRVPTGLMPLQVKSVSVTDRNGVIWVEAEFNGRAWLQTSAVAGGKVLDTNKMSAFNQFWTGMVAETWVAAKREAPEVGLSGTPVWKIRITPDPGRAGSAAVREFLVGLDGPGNTMYAVLDGDPNVFLVPPNVAGMLRGGIWKE
ncbi:MAG: DUF4340 domain-containing protein [Planctomycetota bacterium]